jgi:hypothetical protein
MALTNPVTYINDAIVQYKPNSIKWHDGDGEKKVRTATTGGGNKTTLTTLDIESMRSMFSITIYSEHTPIDTARAWKRSTSGVSIDMVDDNFSRSFTNCVVIGNIEFSAGIEGEFEVTFEGDTSV